MRILCFGNPLVEEDSMAKKIADSINIKGVEIVYCNNADDVLNYVDDEIIIIDVIKNINEVVIFDDIDKIKENTIVTLHDFDLGFFLKVLKSIGRVKKVKIIGVPQEGDEGEIREKTKTFIYNLT